MPNVETGEIGEMDLREMVGKPDNKVYFQLGAIFYFYQTLNLIELIQNNSHNMKKIIELLLIHSPDGIQTNYTKTSR